MDRLVGERVVIRPFREDELEVWRQGLELLEADAQPAGPPPRPMLALRIRRGGLMEDGQIDLAIEVDGRVVGDIQTQRPAGVLMPPATYQIGIAVFDAQDRGKGYGFEAMRLFVAWLFEVMRAERVQAGTAPENAAMRRVFDRLGLTEERPIDVFGQQHLLYAMSRERWEQARSG